MEKKIITFTADEQSLRKTGGIPNYASNKVSYIEAQFELGENWQGFDAVRAIWYNKAQTISMVLADGKCIVPYEVLANKGQVMINLVGSISENDVLTDRLTTYPVVALIVDADAKVDGSNTYPITPSQFEQFVEAVKADAESASESAESASASAESASASAKSAHDDKIEIEQKIAEVIQQIEDFEQVEVVVNTLPAGSQATSDFADGVLTLGIPQGAKGDTGNGIASCVLNADYTLTINFTDGTSYTTPSIRGAQGVKGDTGNGISSITKTGSETVDGRVVDTYTTTFTDGETTGFKVTNGKDGEVTMSQLSALLPTDTASGDIASFPDGTDLFPALSVKAQIEPIQSGSGTPSPDNVRPISGHTECVTVDDSMYGGYIEFNQNVLDALASGSGTASANYATIATLTLTNDMFPVGHKILAKGKMKSANGTNVWLAYSPSNLSQGGNVLTDRTSLTDVAFIYSVDSNYTGRRLRIVGMSGDTATWEDVMLFDLTQMFGAGNEPTTIEEVRALFPKDYYEYNTGVKTCVSAVNGTEYHTYTTNLGRTVYGGTLDVVSGELVVDRLAFTLDGSEARWFEYPTRETEWCYLRDCFGADKPLPKYILAPNWGIADGMNCVANIANGGSIGTLSTSTANGGANLYVSFPAGITSLVEFKSWLHTQNVTVCYYIATPQTYQLDPQTIDLLLGQNNLWTDCGAVEVTYKADIERWVNKKINALI